MVRRTMVVVCLVVGMAMVVGAGSAQAAAGQYRSASAGVLFSCAIKSSTGAVACWGSNDFGQSSPPAGSFSSVNAGQNHACAITSSDGSVACWGYNAAGQTSAPAGSFSAVSGSAYDTCGLKSADGSIVCWGGDYYGEGDAPPGSHSALAEAVQAGCAIRSVDGAIDCWGNTDHGYGFTDHGELDAPAGSFSVIDGHGYTFCAIRSADGTIACWGDNSNGQATDVPAGSFSDVGVGQSHVCAVRSSDRKIVCWGENGSGQSTPPDQTYASVDAGETHTCAIRTVDGRVDCWGSNSRGQTHAPPVPAGETSSFSRSTDNIAADGTSTATIGIQVRDQYGDAWTTGGVSISPHTTLGTIFAFSHVGGGLYQGTLQSSTTPGTAFVTAELNGVSPVNVPDVNAQNFVHFTAPPLTATPATKDFGSRTVGTTSPSQAFTVTNTSGADLTITTVALQGTAPGDFTRFGAGCLRVTLHDGDSCQVSALFSPQTAGAKQATLRVSGSGEITEIALSGTAVADTPFSFNPSTWDFGTAYVGLSSSTKSFVVTNTSGVAQTLQHVDLTGADAADFVRFAGQCLNSPIAPGGSCTVTAALRPQSAGPKSAQLVFRAASGAVQSFALSGTGSASAPLAFTPASADIGSVAVGSSSTTRSFVVQNASGHAVLVTGAALTDATDWVGYLSGCRNVGLLPGQSCTISVRFTPKSAGAKATRIKVTSDSGVPQFIDLTGTGTVT